MKRLVKTVLQSPAGARLLRPLARTYRGAATGLMYHRVTPALAADFLPNAILGVSPERFAEQLDVLARTARCVDLVSFFEQFSTGVLREHVTLVTFDDGYRDNLTHALPLLEKYGIPAAIFVTTGFVDGSTAPWWLQLERKIGEVVEISLEGIHLQGHWATRTPAEKYRTYDFLNGYLRSAPEDAVMDVLAQLDLDPPAALRGTFLTWDDIRELDAHPLVTIGAHTVSHPALRNVSPDRLAAEIGDGRRILEDRLGHPVPWFAYPFGGVREAVEREFQAARNAGFCCSFTARPGHIQRGHAGQPHALPRLMMTEDDRAASMQYKLSGLDAMVQQRGRRMVVA
jgi:peptidoglycan/xylan/chitin deacetylase (PgdA/CDA1 family)